MEDNQEVVAKKTYQDVGNLRMREGLISGKIIDLSDCERTLDGHYVMDKNVVEGKDYCDMVTEAWIWSIGKRKADGLLLASTSSVFFGNADYKCMWLR